VVLAVVAGGHNDLLIGVAVLAGVLAARERRPALAGLLLAVAMLVKLTAVLPLVAVVTWLAFRHGLRAGARAAATAAATVILGYALGGGTTALEPLRQASSNRSKASLWSFPVSWIERSLLGMRTTNVHAVTSVAVVAVAVLALVVVAARLRDVDPAVAAGGAVLVYLLAAAYVLPWYAAWGLPVLALAWRSRLALIAQLQASVLLLVYVDRPGVHSAVLHDVVGAIATHVVPVLEAAALVALVVVSARRLRATRTEAFA
jgi:alpha-1,6-mannosyltransferase